MTRLTFYGETICDVMVSGYYVSPAGDTLYWITISCVASFCVSVGQLPINSFIEVFKLPEGRNLMSFAADGLI